MTPQEYRQKALAVVAEAQHLGPRTVERTNSLAEAQVYATLAVSKGLGQVMGVLAMMMAKQVGVTDAQLTEMVEDMEVAAGED